MTKQEAEELLAKWRDQYSDLRRWWKESSKLASDAGSASIEGSEE